VPKLKNTREKKVVTLYVLFGQPAVISYARVIHVLVKEKIALSSIRGVVLLRNARTSTRLIAVRENQNENR